MTVMHNLEVIGCRLFQAIFKVCDYAVPYRMPKYIEGPGSVKNLPEFMREHGCNNALVVTDQGLMRLGLPNAMLEALEQAGIRYTCFSDIGPNPTTEDVEKGYLIFKENGCKCVIAFGGGSPMDCAKAICAKAVHPKKSVTQLQGLMRVLRPIPPIFAVPTTSGTGSETTIAAVITDSATHRKASINDPFLIPKYAVLDPELTRGLPPHITATTGMDALCHAIESYTNHTYNTRIENELSKKAVKLIYDNILTVYEDGSNLEARQNMQRAALYAGRSFTRGCVGYVHAIGHTLGGLYGVAHGLAMAVLLPHVLEAFGSAVHKRLAELAEVCGIPGDTDAEKARGLIDWIRETNRKMGIPDSLDVIREQDIDQMITWARKEAHPLYPTPAIWSRENFRTLIRSVCK